MAEIVPLSVITAPKTNYTFGAAIGSTRLHPSKLEENSYWLAVVDRYDLSSVVANVVSKSNSEVPPEVSKFELNDDYFLICATLGLTTPNLPQGNLKTLLDDNGGKNDLARLEQIYSQFSCGEFGWCNFACVGVLGASAVGYGTSSYEGGDRRILTLSLQPTEVNGKTMYTPIANSTHTFTPAS